MKKTIALLLAILMTFSMVACSKSAVTENSKPENETSNSVEETSVKKDTDAENIVEEQSAEPVSLRLVMFGDVTPRREEYMKNEFHDKVLEDLNIDLSVEYLPWTGVDVLQTMLVSGEKIAFNNTPQFTDFAQKGLCAEIPMDLIEANCPEYLAMRENNGFECSSIDGKIYYVPFGCKSNGGMAQFFTVRNDILKELGYNADDITTIDQLLEVFEAVHQAYPGMRVVGDMKSMATMVGYALTGEQILRPEEWLYTDELEDNDKVYSFAESELFKEVSDFNAMLVEKGYSFGDELTDPGKDTADWNAGNCFSNYGAAGEIIETTFKETLPNAEIGRIKIGDAPFTIRQDYDWGMSISNADADNIENWLRLFNWMYKDQETYNFLIYGVEGKDFEYNDDGTINKLTTDPFWDDWFMMANCYQIYDPSLSAEAIEIYENTDKDALLSKAAGFSFDIAPVSMEISLVDAAYNEYMRPIFLGLNDYETYYDNALKQLKDAGLDTVVAEYQRQFSEWWANNH